MVEPTDTATAICPHCGAQVSGAEDREHLEYWRCKSCGKTLIVRSSRYQHGCVVFVLALCAVLSIPVGVCNVIFDGVTWYALVALVSGLACAVACWIASRSPAALRFAEHDEIAGKNKRGA